MRLPRAVPPTPTQNTFDVVISQLVGLPTTGTTVRERPTGGSEWQVVVLAEALAAAGFSVAVIGPFFAFAFDRGVQYIPAGEVVGRRGADGEQRPSIKVRAKVLVSQRFGNLPPGVEFERLVVDLHDIPDARLGGVAQVLHEIPDSKVVVHSEFTKSLLDEWPNVNVIPCMLPDEFYQTPATIAGKAPLGRVRRYVYGSAAMKGLEPTLALWRELKRTRNYHFRKATLTVTSPGYDQINPEWLKDQKDVEVVAGLSPAGMQQLLADSDGIFHVSTYAETFGIVFHQCEVAGKRVRVLQLHRQDDALHETLNDQSGLHTTPERFVDHFLADDIGVSAKDFRVSTILPQWLKVLGLSAEASEAPKPSLPAGFPSDVSADGSTQQEVA